MALYLEDVAVVQFPGEKEFFLNSIENINSASLMWVSFQYNKKNEIIVVGPVLDFSYLPLFLYKKFALNH